MRKFCAQNFSSIECNCEELSCKRTDAPDTLTDSRVYSLSEYTKTNNFFDIIFDLESFSQNFLNSIIRLKVDSITCR